MYNGFNNYIGEMSYISKWQQKQRGDISMANGMFYCPCCGKQQAVWQNDYDLEDYGIEGEGIVHIYSCSNCNAEITAVEKINEDI